MFLFNQACHLEFEPETHCEKLWRKIARDKLGVKPSALELYGLRKSNGLWLSPLDKIPSSSENPLDLELRIRFKTPLPDRLKAVDRQSFLYFFDQVRYDFDHSRLLKPLSEKVIKEMEAKKSPWYVPHVPTGGNKGHSELSEAERKRVKFLAAIVRVVSICIVIDMYVKEKEKKEIFKKFEKYVPKEVWSSSAEKMMQSSKFKGHSERIVDKILAEKNTVDELKLLYLNEVQTSFSKYFEEVYPNIELRDLAQLSKISEVVVKVSPPLKTHVPPHEERSGLLSAVIESTQEEINLCTIEEICNISTTANESTVNVEIARRNGVPIYLAIRSSERASSLLTALCGYYRLSEKWTFILCPSITYPSLETLLKSKVHGPVDQQFVIEKFKASPDRLQPGTYLLRRDVSNHYSYFLHYVTDNSEFRVIPILFEESSETFSIVIEYLTEKFDDAADLLSKKYADIGALAKDLINVLGLKTCLHPSEFDRARTLLLCRSVSATEADFIGHGRSVDQEPKVFIPVSALAKYESYKLKGRFTNVWIGKWTRSAKHKEDVAIKQLKSHCDSQLRPFMQMCYNTMLWNDPTLIRVHGATLETPNNPMALVMEFLQLGPLDTYLKQNRDKVTLEDLLESATALAKALWYLGENQFVHSNIRLCNVLVAAHDPTEGLKVKLGDPGLPDYSAPNEVHWLSLELLLDSCPTPSKCTQKGDVWAFATTLWELFSYGERPTLDHKFAKQQYLDGHRLGVPQSLLSSGGQLSSIYQVMQGCWNPLWQVRLTPQYILRELNQLLYKVFNAKKVHTYVTMDEPMSSTVSSQYSPLGSVKTIATNVDSNYTDASRCNMSNHDASSLDSENEDDRLESFGNLDNALVPMFTEWMNDLKARFPNFADNQGASNMSWADSRQNLISSRSGSSMDGTYSSFRSQFTMQTTLSSNMSLFSMPSIYNINDDQVKLNTGRPLGEGNFGIVYKGLWTRSNDECEEVAVKMLKDINDRDLENELERELEIMSGLEHENIVKILASMKVAESGNLAFVMEYVREGSLDNYLRTNKCPIKQMFVFADNICDGMIYLSGEGIIHRDLAARNVLVANEEQVKISDFGLARQSREKDYYQMTSNTNIPIKWMAIESLTHRIFATQSDIWSFGVVLWEMFSHGQSPYLDGCQDFFKADQSEEKQKNDCSTWIHRLYNGARFPKPQLCPAVLYSQVLLPCWDDDYKLRPNFKELKRVLSNVELQVT